MVEDGRSVRALAVDVNQDGFDDIVTANHHSGNVSVVLNQFQFITPGP